MAEGEKQQHHEHDKGYKELLSNKKTFLELLRTFVNEDWVQTIDENELLLVNKTFVLSNFQERESDIIYRLQTSDGDIIFYVLLELQSTVDYSMPLRLLIYMAEIWRDIYQNTEIHERERKSYRVPVIIPAVLYNGVENWTASEEFRDLLSESGRFGSHALNFRYLLFDVNRYQEEDLYKAANLIASVFALDQKMGKGEVVKRLKRLAEWIKGIEKDEFRVFTTWLEHVLLKRLGENQRKETEEILSTNDPREVEQMIYNIELALEEMQEQAMKDGKLEGEQKGKLEDARNALIEGIEPTVVAKITGLSLETIQKIKIELAN